MGYFLEHFEEFRAQDAFSRSVYTGIDTISDTGKLINTNHVFVCVCVCVLSACVRSVARDHSFGEHSAYIRICLQASPCAVYVHTFAYERTA